MSSTTTSFTGSCSCHYIQYTCNISIGINTSTPTTIPITNCHCTECRKLSGGPYQSWADVPRSSITWSTSGGPGGPTKRRSSPMATRSFCSRCGSSLTMVYDFESDVVGIAVGTIDDRSPSLTTKGLLLKPTAHIWLKEKAIWFELDESDGVERFQEHRPQMEELVKKWRREQAAGQE